MNDQVLKEYCYLVNETFRFIEEHFESIVPAGKVDQGILLWTKDVFKKAEKLRTEGKAEELETLAENYLKYSLEYFKCNTPWQEVREDWRICCNTILNTVQLIANLSILLNSLNYDHAAEVTRLLGLDGEWKVCTVRSGYEIPNNAKGKLGLTV